MSRQVTETTVRKFLNDESFRMSNTEVRTDFVSTRLYLFGNCIAKKDKESGRIEVSLAGWNTVTTRERLNGIPGVSVTQKNYIPYLNGKEINSNEWYEVAV